MEKITDKIAQGLLEEAQKTILERMNDLLQEKAEALILSESDDEDEEKEEEEDSEDDDSEDEEDDEDSDEEEDDEDSEEEDLEKKSDKDEDSDEDEMEEACGKKVIKEAVDIFAIDVTPGQDPERDVVVDLVAKARSYGSGEPIYQEGLLYVEMSSKQASVEFGDYLEDHPDVVGYEIQVLFDDTGKIFQEDGTYDMDQITDNGSLIFAFYIYINPEIVQYASYEMEVDEGETLEDTNGRVDEVVRKIKINFRGKKRIKMKCGRGFKWNVEKRTCEKIAGSDLAKMRKSLRRAVLTKKSKGASYKARILRKSRKAKRFRKMMGL